MIDLKNIDGETKGNQPARYHVVEQCRTGRGSSRIISMKPASGSVETLSVQAGNRGAVRVR